MSLVLRSGHRIFVFSEYIDLRSGFDQALDESALSRFFVNTRFLLLKPLRSKLLRFPGPVKVKPGMTYSVDFATAVATDKYDLHLPLERQRRKMESAGLVVDVKTLYDMCLAVAEHCQAILPRIKHEIKTDYAAVTIDETPWRILSDKTYGRTLADANQVRSLAVLEEVFQFTLARAARENIYFKLNDTVVFDKGYVDYGWMNELNQSGVTFVTRAKANFRFKIIECRKTNRTQANGWCFSLTTLNCRTRQSVRFIKQGGKWNFFQDFKAEPAS